ncbi:hypothetical protein DFP72DRAFT_1069661 [Ephemerocybe angulata]|uniref:Uncharacterized protein n=1 Tax=Ephemerocybe angulata TaxID=980116 RepID=A0A8H6M3K1_9AGAR|nr:hypothetical protein DFP72DRAFT_1069661 [Tulosesus angulatus]
MPPATAAPTLGLKEGTRVKLNRDVDTFHGKGARGSTGKIAFMNQSMSGKESYKVALDDQGGDLNPVPRDALDLI